MKLTKREKTLLYILVVTVFLWSYYAFLVIPQLEKLNALKMEQQKYKNQIARLESASIVENQLDDQIDQNREQMKQITSKYFSDMEQGELILLLNELFHDPHFKIRSITFTPYTKEMLGETEVEVISADLSYESDYSTLIKHLKSIWTFQKKIIIKSMNISYSDHERLSGNLQLNFYRVHKSPNLSDDLFRWNIEKNSSKDFINLHSFLLFM